MAGLHHVAWQAKFEAKESDESRNDIGSRWGVVRTAPAKSLRMSIMRMSRAGDRQPNRSPVMRREGSRPISPSAGATAQGLKRPVRHSIGHEQVVIKVRNRRTLRRSDV